MPISSPQRIDFRASVIKALANTPAAMDLACKYGITPSEVGTLLYEALLHKDGSLQNGTEDLPITAIPPREFMCLTPAQIRAQLSDYPGFERMGHS